MLPHGPAASGAVAAAGQTPEEYLRTVFDGYADRFEQHLISLGYRVPGLIRAELEVALAAGHQAGPVLDLGCGTGMVAVAVGDSPIGPITGVDLSERMLAQAAAKHVYQHLEQADLARFLADNAGLWRTVIAADVFCYFGDLKPALAAIAARLAPGGLLVFSVELLADAGEAPWRLGRLARYGHREAYIGAVVAEVGLSVEDVRVEALRFEAEAPVAGLLVRARR